MVDGVDGNINKMDHPLINYIIGLMYASYYLEV